MREPRAIIKRMKDRWYFKHYDDHGRFVGEGTIPNMPISEAITALKKKLGNIHVTVEKE